MDFYQTKVAITVETDKGTKTRNEVYLVRAESVTDAEAKIYKDFESFTDQWEVTAVVATKIIKVIE